jgi:hypothetical protein
MNLALVAEYSACWLLVELVLEVFLVDSSMKFDWAEEEQEQLLSWSKNLSLLFGQFGMRRLLVVAELRTCWIDWQWPKRPRRHCLVLFLFWSSFYRRFSAAVDAGQADC